MYPQFTKRIVTFFAALREELNRQFLTVFAGYFLLSMVSFYLLELENYGDQSAFGLWTKVLIRSTQQASMIVLLLSLKPRLGRKIHLFLICLAFPSLIVNAVHMLLYDSLLHSGSLGAIFFASFHQMGGYINTFGPMFFVVVVPLVFAFPLFWQFRFDKIGRHAKILCAVLFAIMVNIQVTSDVISAAKSPKAFLPTLAEHLQRRAYECTFTFGNDATAIYTFAEQYIKLRNSTENMKKAAFDAKAGEGAPELAVIVIGESLSRYHLPMYGYPRMTAPNLQERTDAGDMLVYEDVIAFTSITRLSLMRALTRADRNDVEPFYRGESIVAAANSAGYDTYWISNAGMLTPHDAEHTALARQAKTTQMVNTNFRRKSLDEKLLEVFDQALEAPSKRKLIVLHTLGSHPQYKRRFSDAFAKFDGQPLPEGMPELTKRGTELYNDYDNSVLYTDDFLGKVLDRIDQPDRNVVFLYFSDHGQNVLETDLHRIGHAFPNPSKREIDTPMMIWGSELYQAVNARTWDNLKANRKAPYTLEYLFDTAVDLLRIESKDWTGDKSLAKPDPPVYDRVLMTPDSQRFFKYDPDRLLYK